MLTRWCFNIERHQDINRFPNTPNGSWGIVQVQATTQMTKKLHAPRIQSSSIGQGRSRRVGVIDSRNG